MEKLLPDPLRKSRSQIRKSRGRRGQNTGYIWRAIRLVLLQRKWPSYCICSTTFSCFGANVFALIALRMAGMLNHTAAGIAEIERLA